MKVIPKLQQGNTIESDNTKVVRPEIHEPIKAKPRQYSIVDLGGEPSNDTRSAAERNRDYWHPIKGARDRFKASMSNETNPLVGIERTILPSAAGAALMDKVGRPFILQQSNPIWIEGKSVRNPELVTMAHGGRFDFKKSPLLKKQEEINGKRDMRKKFIKSSRPTYKKRIKKAQQGMRFVSYNPVSNPTIDYTDITNPINPFSEYNYNTTYDKPEALVVPVRDTDETDVVANNPTAEPVINKPVASKVTYTPKSYKGLAAFNKAYDEVEASNPEAKKYRQFLTKMAEQESGFNSAIQNRAGAPAYGYFQFMQDDKKYNNIRQYADTDIETFRNNPKLQIEAAIKLAKSFEKGFSKEDLELANKNGYSTWGLLGGAWLAGNGGVRKFLRGQGNPSDRHWSKEGKGTDVATRIKAFNFKEGGIIKYQEPAQPIKYMGGYDKRGNMVLPVTNENGMNNVTLPEVTVTPRNINLAGAVDRGRREAAPYVSTLLTGAIFGPLSVAGGYAGNEAVNKITNVASNDKYKDWADMLSKTTGMNPVVADFFNIGNLAGGFGMRNFGPKLKPVKDMAVGGNKWARARVISKAIDKGTPSVEPLPNNVGWGPRQSIHVVHDKNSARLPKLYFPERWDAIHEGAPEVGIWYQGKLGNPRTAANHSIPGKAEKAAKARERFAKRPYRVEGDLELERPIVTVGDVPNRAALERAADKMSADGVIFNNVYDNGYSNNQVIFSLRDDLKNGRVFKKGAKHLATPANNSLLVDMSGVTPRPLSEFSSLSDAELAKLLPDYAHPNWQGDGFKLVKERLWNGGFDRLEKYGDISRYSPQQRTIILNSNPKIETSVTLGEQPGTGTYRETYSINKDVLRDYTLQQSSDVKAHEMVHYMYRPSKEQEAELAYNVRQYFKRPEGRDYFRQSRATEQTARGTQIKNYYGLNEGNQDITPAMWEYARRNYVKDTGINNNMTEWLNSVDERDISAFVKWLSNNAPVIAAPLIGGTMYENNDSK